jgi:hypothetical protein
MAVVTIVVRIAAATAVVIAAVADAGAAVEDDAAEAGHRAVRVAAETCLLQNMHHRRAANPAATTIAAGSRAVTTIGDRKLRGARRLPRPMSPRKRSFSPANRSQNIAASLWHHPHLLLLPLSMKRMKNGRPPKR